MTPAGAIEQQQRPPLLLSGLDSLYVSHYLDAERSQLDFDELEYPGSPAGDARPAPERG